MKILIFVMMFFLVGAFFIISEKNLALGHEGSLSTFSSLYASWLSQVFGNTFSLSGYIVKMEWLPNETVG
jgi:hypothetical protein